MASITETQLTQATSTDYLSALIFWLYIVAALYFTARTIQVILNQGNATSDSNKDSERPVRSLTVFAIISFATLSANMLNILIRSYLAWSAAAEGETGQVPTLASIWQWSLQTKQFHEFILALFVDHASFAWSSTGLVVTFFICTYVAIEGKRTRIAPLWPFFGLSQILPISFTAALFFLARARSTTQPAPVRVAWLQLVLVFFNLYLLCIIGAERLHQSRHASWLMPVVLLARLLLLAPIACVRTAAKTTQSRETTDRVRPYLAVVVWTLVTSLILEEGRSVMNSSWDSIRDHIMLRPAVSTLACDLVLTAIACLWWASFPPPQQSQERLKGE